MSPGLRIRRDADRQTRRANSNNNRDEDGGHHHVVETGIAEWRHPPHEHHSDRAKHDPKNHEQPICPPADASAKAEELVQHAHGQTHPMTLADCDPGRGLQTFWNLFGFYPIRLRNASM